MLYLISDEEDPTSTDCGVYEAATAAKALELAEVDGWGDTGSQYRDGAGTTLHVFEIKKSTKRKFVKKVVWVNDKEKAN